jgi:hypothetical protein
VYEARIAVETRKATIIGNNGTPFLASDLPGVILLTRELYHLHHVRYPEIAKLVPKAARVANRPTIIFPRHDETAM